MSVLDNVYRMFKTTWTGPVFLLCAVAGAHSFSLLAHALIGWLGAWWCYWTIQEGHGGYGRLFVGYMCWSASWYVLMDALNDATIYAVLSFVYFKAGLPC